MKKNTTDKDRDNEGARAWVSSPGYTTVNNKDGKGGIRYENRVLVNMLVKMYHFDKSHAEAVCKGFALDRRVKNPYKRLKSCTCEVKPQTPFDQNHGHKKNGVPAGFTKAVEEKYRDFR